MIIDDDPVCRALPHDDDIDAADYAAMIVKKINIRPPQTLGNKDRALVGPQDQVDNFRICNGNLSKRTLTMNCRGVPLGKHNWLFGRLFNRQRRDLIAEAFRRPQREKQQKTTQHILIAQFVAGDRPATVA